MNAHSAPMVSAYAHYGRVILWSGRTLALLGIFLCVGLGSVRAHPNLQNAMWVQFEPSAVRVALNVSAKEICVAQQIEAEELRLDANRMTRVIRQHADYVQAHLKLQNGTQALTGQLRKITPWPVPTELEDAVVQYELEYAWSGSSPAAVTFSHTMLAEWPYAAGMAWNVSYMMRAKPVESAEISTWLFPGHAPLVVPSGRSVEPRVAEPMASGSADGRTAWAYVRHGIQHIITGYDHLLFVAALVIATLSFGEMVKVIAAFTLAHTLTLALSVFNFFRLPSSVVEPLIALSIVFVALENVLRGPQAHSRWRLAVAFGFGLVHGLGFAGGLLTAMAGLPSNAVWLALIAFSLGVEIGHQVVVVPLFGALALYRRRVTLAGAPVLRTASLLLAGAGSYYLLIALRGPF
ncbi:MAG: HupE/UreJ family protein [Opitutae bacterium]|nr:HupE/UreJ family protein [Opitutae bacterium]